MGDVLRIDYFICKLFLIIGNVFAEVFPSNGALELDLF
jgi:hypothetical protein